MYVEKCCRIWYNIKIGAEFKLDIGLLQGKWQVACQRYRQTK